ncbi:outer membrane protein [Candidatus Omnitrophota bacterium]
MKTLKMISCWAIVLFMLVSGSAIAQDDPTEGTKGEFYAGAALWMTNMEMTVGTPQITFSRNLDFLEIMENFNGGMMGEYGFRKGKFSLNGALIYAGLKKDLEARLLPGSRTTELKSLFSQLLFGYKLFELPIGETMRFSYDQQAGARYYRMRTTIDRLNTFGGGELSDPTLSWTDFVAGGVFTLDINDKFSLLARGNAGGFGWGSSSELSWVAGGFLDYHFGEHSTLRVGYNYMDIEKAQGPATINIAISGPVIEYIYTF